MQPGPAASMKTLPRIDAFDASMAESRQRYRAGDLGRAFVLLDRPDSKARSVTA